VGRDANPHARRDANPGTRRAAIPDLTAMAKAARAAGARLAVQSAYRSYSTQVGVFNSWVRHLGYAQAITGSARPGHSEHQLGTVIDFRSYGGGAPWSFGSYDWATSKAGRWMTSNAWKYGFVLSYPKNMASQVCYGYEPWHFRYVGRTIAAAIHTSGLTPRYWLWKHGSNQ
jgi:D-alanyl-D-alanine carboxypeptidase